ncbi:MAG TPA: hypothetical protein VGF02_03035 [Pseudolabrys sp.]
MIEVEFYENEIRSVNLWSTIMMPAVPRVQEQMTFLLSQGLPRQFQILSVEYVLEQKIGDDDFMITAQFVRARCAMTKA